jgi:hypothetical protein
MAIDLLTRSRTVLLALLLNHLMQHFSPDDPGEGRQHARATRSFTGQRRHAD